MATPYDSSLGKDTRYPDHYDPALLFPIARAAGRAELGIGEALPFAGVDIWNAYELSWLDLRGKPVVALGEFRVPAHSPNLIESKSFKLYLNGYNRERFADVEQVRARLARDLAVATGSAVDVALAPLSGVAAIARLEGETLDTLAIDIDAHGPPDSALLRSGGEVVEESLVSDLLKSNCPVTGQPDWASVQLRYAGPRIDRAGLLRYLVSFRDHAGFHEQCVERIFCDVLRQCAPTRLEVYARYTRRGGLDINPWRGTAGADVGNPRLARQ
ncbi:MAG: NADPH-dependent 7-cyano-7-deazaguanine reductase QueF [Lysobacteraceae bacterium]|nr:MAG: NADPH-dependent 7-cyano-7-deazaguanine reductase QueF [Xanthomonadaceae bacterium]